MTGARGPVSGDARSKTAGRQRGNPSPVPFTDDNLPIEAPPYPFGLRQRTKDIWDAFWSSPVARAVDYDSDRSALERWAKLTDRWFRIMDQLEREDPTVAGTRGSTVLNPLSQEQARLHTQIKDLEAQLGLTPMSRARLGLTAAEGQLVAAQLNAMVTSQSTTGAEVLDVEGWE